MESYNERLHHRCILTTDIVYLNDSLRQALR